MEAKGLIMYRNSVYVQRTSPTTLNDDIDKVLSVMTPSALYSNQRTLIKINGNFDKVYPGSNTSKWFLNGLLKALRERSYRDLAVIEGDLPTFSAANMIRTTGLIHVLKKYDVPFIPYENLPRDKYELPILLQDSQLINVPVFHAHGIAIVSCATKNLFGLLPKNRRKYHKILSEKLLELAQKVQMFTIVDGTVGLDGESTRRGNPRKLDLILAGYNPLTIDTVVSQIMGFSPSDIPLLQLAEEMKLLPLDLSLFGEFDWESLPRCDFKFAHSQIRKGAMALENTRLMSFTPFLWLEDRLRRLYHNLNYLKKRKYLFSGPWMEYDTDVG